MSKLNEITRNAIANVLAQSDLSVVPNDQSCLYRGANGSKCIIGHMIHDSHYSEKLEHNGIDDSIEVVRAVENSNDIELNTRDLSVLVLLQDLHDSSVLSVNNTNGFFDTEVDKAEVVEQFRKELRQKIQNGIDNEYFDQSILPS